MIKLYKSAILLIMVVPLHVSCRVKPICSNRNQFYDQEQLECRKCSEICDDKIVWNYNNVREQCVKPCREKRCLEICDPTNKGSSDKLCKTTCMDNYSGYPYVTSNSTCTLQIVCIFLMVTFTVLLVKNIHYIGKQTGKGHLQKIRCVELDTNNFTEDSISGLKGMGIAQTAYNGMRSVVKTKEQMVQTDLVVIEGNDHTWVGKQEEADEIEHLRRDFPLISDAKEKFTILSKVPWVKRMVSNGRYTRVIYDGDKTRDVEKEICDLVGLEGRLFEFIYEE